jgi:mannose-1-phosphate guanylyltransferase
MAPALCVAIMAGGRGLRLWPRSSAQAPKQLRAFFGGPVLLQQSLAAAAALTAPGQTYIITGADLVEPTRAIAGAGARVLAEPRSRDTAACAGLAALHIEREHPEAVMLLLPADHWVGDQAAFHACVSRAVALAAAHDTVVTLGVRPTRVETGYGYIEVAETAADYYQGLRFREKPGHAEAAAMIARGGVLWNAGIYAVRARTLLDLIRRHLPPLGAGLDRIAAALGTPQEQAVIREVYDGLRPISLDHGVAEKLDAFLVVPANFPWDDLGTWTAFTRVLPADGTGNLTAGQVYVRDATNCLVDTPDLQTTLLGVSDLIVVQDGNRLLIAAKHRAQDVKSIAAVQEGSP